MIQKRKIYIRTDANKTIATGHIMRCITIGKCVEKLDTEVVFLVSDNESVPLLEKNSMTFIVLNTNWSNLNTTIEIDKLIQIFVDDCNNGIRPVLFIDSYAINNEYCIALKQYAGIAVLDNMFLGVFDADLVINYTIFHSKFNYSEVYKNKNARLLLGTQYVPLREQFLKYYSKNNIAPDGAFNILLMCGGSDKDNIIKQILEYGIRNALMDDDNYHVIVGAYNPNYNSIKEIADSHKNIDCYSNIDNMADFMSQCDIVVSAAGTTLYECCAMGIPTVFYCMSEDQINTAKFFSVLNEMLYAGDIRMNNEEVINRVFSLISNHKSRLLTEKFSNKSMKKITDGYGAFRIAKEIITI